MKTIQLKIDESLLAEIERATRTLAMTRHAFILMALEMAVRKQETILLEHRHAHGYVHHPIKPGEFDEWETEFALGFDALI